MWLHRLSGSFRRKVIVSVDKEADVATQQADEVIWTKDKGASDAKTEELANFGQCVQRL